MTYRHLLKLQSQLRIEIEDDFWALPSRCGDELESDLLKKFKEKCKKLTEIESKILSLKRASKQ